MSGEAISSGRGPRALPWLLLVTTVMGCNQPGSGIGTTSDNEGEPDGGVVAPSTPLAELEPEALELVESKTLAAVTDPAFLEGICRLLAVNLGPADCEARLAACADASFTDAGSPVVPDVSVSGNALDFTGCEATVQQWDACLGELAEAVVAESAKLNCEPDGGLPELGPELVLLAPSCLAVALQCPELVAPLLPQAG